MWRDAVGAIITVVGSPVTSFWDRPHWKFHPIRPGLSVYPRPDWYLLWYFSVLALIPAKPEPYVILGDSYWPSRWSDDNSALVANKGESCVRFRRPWAMGR